MFQAHIFASDVMSSPENSQTPSEGKKIWRGGESKRRQFPGGSVGWLLKVLFLETPRKISELSKTSSCSAIVFIDDLLFRVGKMLFSQLMR